MSNKLKEKELAVKVKELNDAEDYITLDEISETLGITKSHTRKLIKENNIKIKTKTEYINREVERLLLERKDLTLEEISYEVGCSLQAVYLIRKRKNLPYTKKYNKPIDWSFIPKEQILKVYKENKSETTHKILFKELSKSNKGKIKNFRTIPSILSFYNLNHSELKNNYKNLL